MLGRRKKTKTISALSAECEQELRGKLVEKTRRAVAEWGDPEFATDEESRAQADRMREELEECGDALEKMFYRSSPRVVEFAQQISAAIDNVRMWKNNVGGQSIVDENVETIKAYIDKWKTL